MQPNNINNKKTASQKSSPQKPHLPSSDLITKKEKNTTLLDSIIQLTSIILYYYIIHLETNPRISLKEKRRQ